MGLFLHFHCFDSIWKCNHENENNSKKMSHDYSNEAKEAKVIRNMILALKLQMLFKIQAFQSRFTQRESCRIIRY